MPSRTEGAPGPAAKERTRAPADISDEELDRYIRVRLALVGVDLSVLPESDPRAPADQVRILRSARSFLRSTVPVISDHVLDRWDAVPFLYPTAIPGVAERRQSPESR
jgi:hypothetical protein